MLGYGYLAIFLLLATLLQVVFKSVAIGKGGTDYIQLLVDPLFYLSCLLLLGQTFAWVRVLRYLPLSHAYPFTSLTIITALMNGALFFGESITYMNVVGGVVIAGGVICITGEDFS